MNDINNVSIVGRLVRDIDVKYTNGGMAIGSFDIAVGRSRKRNGAYEEETSFFNCKLLGKSAENLKPYMTKGQQVALTGYLQQDRWQDDSGATKSRVEIVAVELELIGGKRQNDNRNPDSENYGNF